MDESIQLADERQKEKREKRQKEFDKLREQIDSYYPACINDNSVMDKLILTANEAFAGIIRKNLGTLMANDPDIFYDALQEASMNLYRLVTEMDAETTELQYGLSGFAMRVYKLAALNYQNKELSRKNRLNNPLSLDQSQEADLDNENAGNDRGKLDAKSDMSVAHSPEHILEKGFEEFQTLRLGQLLMQALTDTEAVPHQVVACVYSVLLPQMLKVYLDTRVCIAKDLRGLVRNLWENEYDEEYVKDTARVTEKQYGNVIKERVAEHLKNLENIKVPVDRFCYSMIIKPELELMKDGVTRKERGFYNRVLTELALIWKGEIKVNKDNTVFVECAKQLMDAQSVKLLSENFEQIYNTCHFFSHSFVWGIAYCENLEKPYTDIRHGIKIPVDGDVIFTEYFSRPSSGEEDQKTSRADYLGKNIRNFAVRVREQLIVEILRTVASEEQDFSEFSKRRLRTAYEKFKIANRSKEKEEVQR